MKVLLEEDVLNRYQTRQLFSDVLKLFNEFNANQFLSQQYNHKLNYDEKIKSNSKNNKSNPTLKSVIVRDTSANYVSDFRKKIKFLKTQFTDDELIIYKYSLEEREYDKIIRERIHKSEHKYYQIKKSCYLKIALAFGLVSSLEENSCLEITQNI